MTDEGESESFGLTEFYGRVAEREGVDYPVTVHHARAVVSVVREAVTAGEIDDVREQLPDQYNALFEADVEATT